MKLIPLEETLKILKYYCDDSYDALIEIKSLPTIELPEDRTLKMIDELINEVDCYISASKRDNTPQWTMVYEMQKIILEALKSRLYLLTQK